MARSPREGTSKLGPSLRDVREGQKRSLRDVEKRSGLSNGYLSQLERNEVEHPSPTVLRKLATGYEVEFLVLMQWAGYVEDENLALTPNQAAALSTIGDPTDEELVALRGILDLLRSKDTATSYAAALPGGGLDFAAKTEISGYARSLLLEAGGFGQRPTPLEQLSEAANLVKVGQLELSPSDRAKLTARFGHWVEMAWNRLRGAVDFRSQSIWIKPDLHPKQHRFTLGHEIGHAILPAHRETFAYLDNLESLAPSVRALFEQEANHAAAQLLFQCGELTEEADSSLITLERICQYADSFGASIVSTAREVAETSRREVAIAIAHQPRQALGPTNLFTSPAFEERFRWQSYAPPAVVREKLVSADRRVRRAEFYCPNAREEQETIRIEWLHTSWAALVLVRRDPIIRRTVQRLVDDIPF